MPAGYSGTPLWKKLGVRDGQRTWRSAMPASVAEEIAQGGLTPMLLNEPADDLEMVHVFLTERTELVAQLASLLPLLKPAGMFWVSWPKKAARTSTDITEHVVREEAFPLGLVDVKVCAVDETWTGLKLVIRKTARGRFSP